MRERGPRVLQGLSALGAEAWGGVSVNSPTAARRQRAHRTPTAGREQDGAVPRFLGRHRPPRTGQCPDPVPAPQGTYPITYADQESLTFT